MCVVRVCTCINNRGVKFFLMVGSWSESFKNTNLGREHLESEQASEFDL